jgi:hypothetical protein
MDVDEEWEKLKRRADHNGLNKKQHPAKETSTLPAARRHRS